LITARAQPGVVVVFHGAKSLSTLSVILSALSGEIPRAKIGPRIKSHLEKSRDICTLSSTIQIIMTNPASERKRFRRGKAFLPKF
jgi:hypothetical protein